MRALLSLALLATFLLFLPPAEARQDGPLSLKNPRLVYSMYGQDRKDPKLLPGDIFWLAYDIDGLKQREDGKVLYSIGMELTSAKDGKSIFKQAPTDLEATNSLGGGRKPAFAYLEIGKETAPGEYNITLTVTDRTAKTSQKLDYKFTVLPTQFGFVQSGLSLPDYRPTPPIAVPGQEFWVHFGVTGFERNMKKQPDLGIELQVIDLATNKAIMAKPITGAIKEVTDEFKEAISIPWTQPLSLNRPGRFKVKVVATDNYNKKTADLELDFTVLDVK